METPSPVFCGTKKEFHRCLKIVARSKEMLTVPLRVVWHWIWLEPRPVCTLPRNRPHAPSLGLVPTTHWKNNGFKLNTAAKCSRFKTFNWVLFGADDPRHAPQEKEAWQTSGTLTTVTSSVTQSWYRPVCERSTQPIFKSEQSETHARQKSFNIWQTSMLPYQNGPVNEFCLLATFSTAASNTLAVAVGRRQFIAAQLLAKADVIRATVQLCQDRRKNLPFSARVGVSRINHTLRVHRRTILQERRAAQILRWSRAKVAWETLSRNAQWTAWNKQRLVLASRVLGTRGRGTLPALHTLEHSLQPSREFWIRFKTQSQPYLSRNNLKWLAWTLSLKQPPPPSLKRSTARKNPQLGCTWKKRQPRQRTSPASKQFKNTLAHRHESKSVRDWTEQLCFTGWWWWLRTHFCSTTEKPSQYTAAPSEALAVDSAEVSEGHATLERCLAASDEDWRFVSHTCLTQVASTWTRARAVPLSRMTSSPTCKGDLATELGRALTNAVLGGSFLDPTLQHRRSHSGTPCMRPFHYRHCLRTQRGSRCVRGSLQCSSSPRKRCTGSLWS